MLLLFISLAFAWYSANDKAEAGGVNSGIAGDTLLIESVKYYKIADVENISDSNGDGVNFKIGDTYMVSSTSTLKMPSYDTLSETPTQILMEVVLEKSCNISSFNVQTTSNSYLNILEESNNPLSSIISFYYLDNLDEINSSTYYSAYNRQAFVTLNDSNPTFTKNISFIKNKDNVKCIYILLAYYEESIENIYTNNLGSDVLTKDVDISYTCDFKFFLSGEVKL